jgi:hypothetical protein
MNIMKALRNERTAASKRLSALDSAIQKGPQSDFRGLAAIEPTLASPTEAGSIEYKEIETHRALLKLETKLVFVRLVRRKSDYQNVREPGDWAGTTVFYLRTEATKLAIWALDAIPIRINTIVQST